MEGVKTLSEEIDALQTKIADLDKSVAEATEQRKSENKEFSEAQASNAAAKELNIWPYRIYTPVQSLPNTSGDRIYPPELIHPFRIYPPPSEFTHHRIYPPSLELTHSFVTCASYFPLYYLLFVFAFVVAILFLLCLPTPMLVTP